MNEWATFAAGRILLRSEMKHSLKRPRILWEKLKEEHKRWLWETLGDRSSDIKVKVHKDHRQCSSRYLMDIISDHQ